MLGMVGLTEDGFLNLNDSVILCNGSDSHDILK